MNGELAWLVQELLAAETNGELVHIISHIPPGVDFTNILRAPLTLADLKSADLKSAKNTVKPSVFIALLGSEHVKPARKMLVKLTPGTKKCSTSGFRTVLLKYKGIFK